MGRRPPISPPLSTPPRHPPRRGPASMLVLDLGFALRDLSMGDRADAISLPVDTRSRSALSPRSVNRSMSEPAHRSTLLSTSSKLVFLPSYGVSSPSFLLLPASTGPAKYGLEKDFPDVGLLLPLRLSRDWFPSSSTRDSKSGCPGWDGTELSNEIAESPWEFGSDLEREKVELEVLAEGAARRPLGMVAAPHDCPPDKSCDDAVDGGPRGLRRRD
eukprot:1569367-Rhodomonas_salina.12